MPAKRLVKLHGNDRWEVDFGVDVTGLKKRKYCKTEIEANHEIERYEKELKSCGEYWSRLKPLDREVTVATLRDIEAKKQTIASVWADWQRWRKDNQQTVTTEKAYADVVAEWKRRKLAAGKTARYVRDAAGLLSQFGEGREQQNIHEIPSSDLEDWIDSHQSWSLSSKTHKHVAVQFALGGRPLQGLGLAQHREPARTGREDRSSCQDLPSQGELGGCAMRRDPRCGTSSTGPRRFESSGRSGDLGHLPSWRMDGRAGDMPSKLQAIIDTNLGSVVAGELKEATTRDYLL